MARAEGLESASSSEDYSETTATQSSQPMPLPMPWALGGLLGEIVVAGGL